MLLPKLMHIVRRAIPFERTMTSPPRNDTFQSAVFFPQLEEGVLNGVSVTPLSPMHMSQGFTYLEKMYSIKKIM